MFDQQSRNFSVNNKYHHTDAIIRFLSIFINYVHVPNSIKHSSKSNKSLLQFYLSTNLKINPVQDVTSGPLDFKRTSPRISVSYFDQEFHISKPHLEKVPAFLQLNIYDLQRQTFEGFGTRYDICKFYVDIQVLLQNGKMIGVTVQIDLIDYLKLPSMPNHLQFFKKLDQVGAQLQSHIKLQKQIKGHAVYGLYGVIDPQFANKGYSLRFWWQCMAVGKEAGWKYYYSRISNIYSLKLLQKLGAEIIAEADLVDQDRKQKFWMVRVNFSKPLPSFTKLKQMLAKDKLKEKKPLPKL